MTQIAPQIIQITKAASAAQEMWAVIDREPSIDGLSPEGARPDTCVGDIVLSNISFAYPTRPQVPVLRNVTLEIPANKSTALVGPSGSGKSTVTGLLERWYDPLGGSITLDGRDIKDFNIQWLRTHLRIVQQVSIPFIRPTKLANTDDRLRNLHCLTGPSLRMWPMA